MSMPDRCLMGLRPSPTSRVVVTLRSVVGLADPRQLWPRLKRGSDCASLLAGVVPLARRPFPISFMDAVVRAMRGVCAGGAVVRLAASLSPSDLIRQQT